MYARHATCNVVADDVVCLCFCLSQKTDRRTDKQRDSQSDRRTGSCCSSLFKMLAMHSCVHLSNFFA